MSIRANGRSKSPYGGFIDPILTGNLARAIENASFSRAHYISNEIDPRRSIDDECGYPKTVTVETYRHFFDTFSIARRVVGLMPTESWQSQPEVFETQDSGATRFEEAWDRLGANLHGKGWYKTEEGNPIWEALLRADILSGIGTFGVLLLGISDGLPLVQPALGIDERGRPTGKGKEMELLFLRPFDESMVRVIQCERDSTNPRYGQPTLYEITLNKLDEASGQSALGLELGTVQVHWSRVIHLADNRVSSEVFGSPRMQPVFTHLMDLRKVYGGSAEMFWRGFQGLALETHPQLGGDVDVDEDSLKDMVEEYYNGLQRAMLLKGMSAKTLAPTVVSPTDQIRAQLEAICIVLNVPLRIFLGSERGELASSQDDQTWNDRLGARQTIYLTPRVIVPFVDRLICLHVLPEPKEYMVAWPDLNALSELEKTDIADRRVSMLVRFLQGNGDAMITPVNFLTRAWGLKEEEAVAILDETAARLDEEEEGITSLLPLYASVPGILELFKAGKEGSMTEEQIKQFLMVLYKMPEDKADALIAEGIEKEEPPPNPFEQGPPGQGPGKAPGFPGQKPQGEEPPAKQPKPFPPQAEEPKTENVFCPTGEGGGIDPTCGSGESKGAGGGTGGKAPKGEKGPKAKGPAGDPVTPPPPGKYQSADPYKDTDKDGITESARVGVRAMDVPPPPPIGRMPHLSKREREAETNFAEAYEKDPDGMAANFRNLVGSMTKPGEPKTFGTDDAKLLNPDWTAKDEETRAANRATLNVPLHQTANAIAKRAFLQELDTLEKGSEVLVTVGGCGAGKGYALKAIPEALEAKSKAKVIWDSAGDQNATENPWIQQEVEKRGLHATYVYVHADAENQWANPERGVVHRAEDPKDGRMVDAQVFADSYAVGAKNHQAFYEHNKGNPSASFMFLDNSGKTKSGKPELIDGVPEAALKMDPVKLALFATKVVKEREGLPARVKRGALIGERIWGLREKAGEAYE